MLNTIIRYRLFRVGFKPCPCANLSPPVSPSLAGAADGVLQSVTWQLLHKHLQNVLDLRSLLPPRSTRTFRLWARPLLFLPAWKFSLFRRRRRIQMHRFLVINVRKRLKKDPRESKRTPLPLPSHQSDSDKSAWRMTKCKNKWLWFFF